MRKGGAGGPPPSFLEEGASFKDHDESSFLQTGVHMREAPDPKYYVPKRFSRTVKKVDKVLALAGKTLNAMPEWKQMRNEFWLNFHEVGWVVARRKLAKTQPPLSCFADIMAIFAPEAGADFLTKTLLEAIE